ncbi:CACTA en-spm transposon protein [Cucumis melo var. makuwa]|uniref:CACTA en-spm transposon protein n=1 Tax=Cucumis melo var. makuwa TaxID=1194695 RepID=A0A5D3CC80_CUCMM|nr:CACTA en-spm transposon protein [Cucumis melo var. makuwa]
MLTNKDRFSILFVDTMSRVPRIEGSKGGQIFIALVRSSSSQTSKQTSIKEGIEYYICHTAPGPPLLDPRDSLTTRKWSIPDAEKHVGIKNIGNKGFPDALNNASGDASGKPSFPTHHEGVGKNTLGKGVFPDAVNRISRCHALVGRDEDWHFLCDHYISRAFQEQSRTNKAARQKEPYNHSSGSKSFLQRQYELAERRGQPVDRVELFRETHVRAGTFVSQAAEDAHNQMLELQSQPTPEGSQPLSEDEICDQVLGRRPDYSKGLGWGPKPKARRTASASSSSTSCSQSTQKEIELQAKLHEALKWIEVQDRNHQALASQVEAMKKMIEDLTRAQQGPPHDP